MNPNKTTTEDFNALFTSFTKIVISAISLNIFFDFNLMY